VTRWSSAKDGDGCRWDSSTPHDPVTRVRLHGVGHVRVHQHRPVTGRVTTISVQREGRCYVVLACDEVPAEPLPATGAVTGIDMGVHHFLTTAKGEHTPNPRARQAHRRCPRRRPARGDGVAPGVSGTTEPPGIAVRWRRSPRCIARCAAGGEDHAHKTDLAMVTHVAGTIAAAANGFGISGVAPNVMPANIRAGQDSGYFFLQPVVDALTYAGVAGIDVVNMSFYVDP
jgi:subtilisin family serine protease